MIFVDPTAKPETTGLIRAPVVTFDEGRTKFRLQIVGILIERIVGCTVSIVICCKRMLGCASMSTLRRSGDPPGPSRQKLDHFDHLEIGSKKVVVRLELA